MMEKAIWLLRLVFPRHIRREPFRSYVLTSIWGWPEEAADILLGKTLEELEILYVAEMEHMSTRLYYRLLRYHSRCRHAVFITTQGWLAVDVQQALYCSSCCNAYKSEPTWIHASLCVAIRLLAR